jgi:hypothetical protein
MSGSAANRQAFINSNDDITKLDDSALSALLKDIGEQLPKGTTRKQMLFLLNDIRDNEAKTTTKQLLRQSSIDLLKQMPSEEKRKSFVYYKKSYKIPLVGDIIVVTTNLNSYLPLLINKVNIGNKNATFYSGIALGQVGMFPGTFIPSLIKRRSHYYIPDNPKIYRFNPKYRGQNSQYTIVTGLGSYSKKLNVTDTPKLKNKKYAINTLSLFDLIKESSDGGVINWHQLYRQLDKYSK